MNINAKTQNFNWLVAAALVLLIVAGVALNWQGPSEGTQQTQRADTQRATEAWAANSFVPEPGLKREPTVKLTPAPPLPDENDINQFKPLPPINQFGGQDDLKSLELETDSGDGEPATQFTPLPQINGIVTRELPRMNKIATHPLPQLPVAPARDALASHHESIPAEPSDKSQPSSQIDLQPTENEATSDDGEPATQFTPLPQINGIVTRDLPRMNKIATHPLPQFPMSPAGDALASHQESISAEPSDIAQPRNQIDLQPTENEAASVDGQPAMQFAPLPQINSVETHALPDFPAAPQREGLESLREASPVELVDEASAGAPISQETVEAVGEDADPKIWSLPPEKDFKSKDLPLPAVGDQTNVEQPETTEFGFVKRMAKRDELLLPGARQLNSPSLWIHPIDGAGVQLVTAELELSGLKLGGPVESDTILGILADKEPVSGKAADAPAAVVAKLPKALLEKQKKTKTKKKKKKVVAAPKKGSTPKSASGKSPKAKDDFLLAAQPKLGAHYIEDKPQTDQHAHLIEPLASDFSPDPTNPMLPYEPHSQMNVYQGKTLNANQRPLVELGRPWYQLGQLSPGSSVLGFHNNVTPQFLIYGDHRTGYASNRQNGNSTSQIATQLNLDFDLKLTGTERFHAFVQPLTSGGRNTRRLLDDDEMIFEGSANPAFGYFEGDLGAIVGGATNKTLPFDLPFTAGIIPLVFQNGVWFEDAILGVAATLPARNSPRLNISNMDVTFFAGYDKIDSPAFEGDDSAARIVGVASFLEMLNGYIEIDYAFLDDRTFADRSYHNIGIGYTRRYGRFVSNSTRVIVNAGQNSSVGDNTADGVLLLSENSLITGFPSNVVPYFNFFAGFDRPQSAARAAGSGGVLRNTGILFESDNLTGYPTLDATANDTFGMSLGVEVLSGGDKFSQQLVLEAAALGVMGDAATRNAAGDQYGVGFRYQLPLSNSVIFRADGMYGFLRDDEDVSGIRLEVRKKF